MGLKESLRSIFKRKRKCEKFVRYQGSNFNISVSGSAAGVTIDVKELSKQVAKLTNATNHAKLLDDFQYLLCDEIKELPSNDDYADLLRRYRIVIVAYLTQLGSLLEHIKTDIKNKSLKHELVKLVQKMSQLIDQLRDDIIPSTKHIPKVYSKLSRGIKAKAKVAKMPRMYPAVNSKLSRGIKAKAKVAKMPRMYPAVKTPWVTFDTKHMESSYAKLLTASTFLGLSAKDIDDLLK